MNFYKGFLAGTLVALVVLVGIWAVYGGSGGRAGDGPPDRRAGTGANTGITEWQFAMPSFQLTDQEGRVVSSEELRGKVLVANFIYTHCEAECPLMTAFMASLQRRMEEAGLLGSEVMLLSFSTDPLRDTPAVLRAYAEEFDADPEAWRFLTGPAREQIELIREGFHLAVGYTDASGKSVDPFTEEFDAYEVAHSFRFLLIDRDGEVQRLYRFPDFKLARLAADVEELAAR